MVLSVGIRGVAVRARVLGSFAALLYCFGRREFGWRGGPYHAIGEMGGHLGELDDQELEVFKSGLVGVVGCLKRSDLLLQSNHLFV